MNKLYMTIEHKRMRDALAKVGMENGLFYIEEVIGDKLPVEGRFLITRKNEIEGIAYICVNYAFKSIKGIFFEDIGRRKIRNRLAELLPDYSVTLSRPKTEKEITEVNTTTIEEGTDFM